MAQLINEQTRNKVYDDLADLMIQAADRNDLPVAELKKSAQFILDTLETIKTEDEMIQFLQTLGEKWTAYSVELLRYEGQQKQVADDAKIQEIQNKLSNYMHA